MGGEFNIELSSRMHKLPAYVFGRLNAEKATRRRAGEDVIDLGMGNPNDPAPLPVIDKLCEAVRDPKSHRYSVSADGILSLKKEVAAFYKREWGVELDAENEVVCTIGSKEGISHLALALMDPGQTALVPTPSFPIHIYSIALAGGDVVTFPISSGPEFFDNLNRAVEAIERPAKLLVICFPHNPTTLTVEVGFFEKIVEFARANGIFIVHDFAYSHVTFDGYRAPSFLQVEGAKEVGVEFTSMSKTFSMAGWRVGFCVGHPVAVNALARLKGYYDYGLFVPIQVASIIALRNCMEQAREQAAVYQSRRDVLCAGLERVGWHVEPPKGTMFVWAPIPEKFGEMDSVDFAMLLLKEANVAVAPGAAFGEGGEKFVRMALVENEMRLKQAARQIGRALRM